MSEKKKRESTYGLTFHGKLLSNHYRLTNVCKCSMTDVTGHSFFFFNVPIN